MRHGSFRFSRRRALQISAGGAAFAASAVLGRTGDPAWVTPAFERDRALDQIRLGTDVRAWQEDESAYALVARAVADRGAATGRVGVEEAMPFAFSDGIGQVLPAAR